MGFFDDLAKGFDKAKCLSGFHDWGNWHSEGCSRWRMCRRPNCIVKEEQDCHTWSEWQYIDEECDQMRECLICLERDYRKRHKWGGWTDSHSTRAPVRICRRCGEDETMEPLQILKIPQKDLALDLLLAMKLKTLAPRSRDTVALRIFAYSLAVQADGIREEGYEPEPPYNGFNIYTWEWDDGKEEYGVLQWNGKRWHKVG